MTDADLNTPDSPLDAQPKPSASTHPAVAAIRTLALAKAKNNTANPAPMAGMAKSPEMRDEMAAKKATKKGNKKSTRNKGMSNSSTNDTGTTSAPGTQ